MSLLFQDMHGHVVSRLDKRQFFLLFHGFRNFTAKLSISWLISWDIYRFLFYIILKVSQKSHQPELRLRTHHAQNSSNGVQNPYKPPKIAFFRFLHVIVFKHIPISKELFLHKCEDEMRLGKASKQERRCARY